MPRPVRAHDATGKVAPARTRIESALLRARAMEDRFRIVVLYLARLRAFNTLSAQPPNDPLSETPTTTRSTTRELWTAALLVVLLPLLFDLVGRAVPWVGANLLLFVAATFLWLPGLTLPRSGPHPNDYGIDTARTLEGLKWGLTISLVTLVGFIPGFHLWNTVALDERVEVDVGAFYHTPDRVQGRPSAFEPGYVYVFADDDLVHLRADFQGSNTQILVETDGRVRTFSDQEFSDAASTRSDRVARLTVIARDPGQLRIQVLVDSEPVPLDLYRLGAGTRPPPDRWSQDGELTLPLSIWWLPALVAIQILLIAFPEEYFFRGYFQRRQDELLGASQRVRVVGPIFITRAIIVASAVFALVHFVIGFSPIRLAVFFPSLLFGFLRDKTDNLVAPVTYHAACNLMVHVAAHFYVPG